MRTLLKLYIITLALRIQKTINEINFFYVNHPEVLDNTGINTVSV